ncbi:DUF4143 domain-containing protein [uncultured Treponema sp.]|uniref:DUF4143 domain-containing protein n=1 Tax=uncultured Treponema sp. TaxID=162155 RepID=UPI0015C05815|nr:DUF4143 domain-containing protein [uncultured Treponema sp.]
MIFAAQIFAAPLVLCCHSDFSSCRKKTVRVLDFLFLFRAYTTDLSLLIAMKDFSIKQHIVENTLDGNTKGGIYECAVADILYKKGLKIYFYKNETVKRKIDFIFQKEGQVFPVEVKSGNSRASSLTWLLKNKKNIPTAFKFADNNFGRTDDGIITLPLYMAAFVS